MKEDTNKDKEKLFEMAYKSKERILEASHDISYIIEESKKTGGHPNYHQIKRELMTIMSNLSNLQPYSPKKREFEFYTIRDQTQILLGFINMAEMNDIFEDYVCNIIELFCVTVNYIQIKRTKDSIEASFSAKIKNFGLLIKEKHEELP